MSDTYIQQRFPLSSEELKRFADALESIDCIETRAACLLLVAAVALEQGREQRI